MVTTSLIPLLPWANVRRWTYNWSALTCFRILSRSLSAVITFHNRDHRPRSDGICVANHTTPIDVFILSCDKTYAMVREREILVTSRCKWKYLWRHAVNEKVLARNFLIRFFIQKYFLLHSEKRIIILRLISMASEKCLRKHLLKVTFSLVSSLFSFLQIYSVLQTAFKFLTYFLRNVYVKDRLISAA